MLVVQAAEDRFKKVAQAYEVLSDPKLRDRWNLMSSVIDDGSARDCLVVCRYDQFGSTDTNAQPGGFDFG